ncbi:MAG TPA: fimbria/pilus outer membrane usher protein [Thermoanaerobaculia bacterium]|jgi:outer membrane usher protein|nr:fimbria/pilus outer membrane usher protein [Thermoanaerobaculia bacterium]
MCPLHRREFERALIVVLVLSGLLSSPAAGLGPTEDGSPVAESLQLEVYINGISTELIAAFERAPDGTMSTTTEELDAVGLKLDPKAVDAKGRVQLDRFQGLSVSYDVPTQSLRITASPSAQKAAHVGPMDDQNALAPTRPPAGALLGYTFFASGEDQDELRFDGVAGAFNARLFGRAGTLEQTVIANGSSLSRLGALRLDTTWTYEDPKRLLDYRAGDVIAGGLTWTRPLRLGGVQVRRNFGLRPDLITFPVPILTGTAAATSMLDLYINNVRTLSASIPAGPYEIDHPPVMQGAGLARVVVRDALGRETVVLQPFYASSQLLAPGLTDFSLELGFARRNYAANSSDYDHRPALSASWRNGRSSALTLESHAEAMEGLANLGGGAVMRLGTFALVSVAVAGSHTNRGTGALAEIGFETQHTGYTFSVRSQRTHGIYEDLVSRTAVLPPDSPLNDDIFRPIESLDQARLSRSLWSGASVGASFVQLRQANNRSKIADLSFTQSIGRTSLSLNALQDLDVTGSRAYSVTFSAPLRYGISATTGMVRSRGQQIAYVDVADQPEHRAGAIGWNVRADTSTARLLEVNGRYKTKRANFEAGIFRIGGLWSGTAQMEGSLALIDRQLFVAPPLSTSFAVVDVGVPGVDVLLENRKVGVTGRRGRLIVPDLTAFVPNLLAIDPAGLPVDADIEQTQMVVAPYSASPVLVRLRADTQLSAAIVVLTTPAGEPLEPGSHGQLRQEGDEFVVGYGGETYIRALEASNVVAVTRADGSVCRASFKFHRIPGVQARIEGVVCHPQDH